LSTKLKELKSLRRERLKKQGHLFPEEDNEFFQSLQKEQMDKDSDHVEIEPKASSESLIQLQNIKNFYCQGKNSLRGLLNIRTQWDNYLTSDSKGSCIPLGMVQPVAPFNQDWEMYLSKE